MPTLDLEWNQQSCARTGHQRRTVSNPALMHESIRDFRLLCMHCTAKTEVCISYLRYAPCKCRGMKYIPLHLQGAYPRYEIHTSVFAVCRSKTLPTSQFTTSPSSDFQNSTPTLYESYSEEQHQPGFTSGYSGDSIPSSSYNLAFSSQEQQQHVSLTIGTTQDLSDPNAVDSSTRMHLPEPTYNHRSLHCTPLYPAPTNVWQTTQDKNMYGGPDPDSKRQGLLKKAFYQRRVISGQDRQGNYNARSQCRMQCPSQEYGQDDSGACMSTSLLPSDPAEQEQVCTPDATHMHAQLPTSSSSTPQRLRAASLKPFIHGHQLEHESTSEGTLTPGKTSPHRGKSILLVSLCMS